MRIEIGWGLGDASPGRANQVGRPLPQILGSSDQVSCILSLLLTWTNTANVYLRVNVC